MIVYLSLLVAIIGLVIFLIATKPPVVEVGRLMFACGLLAFLIVCGGPLVNLLGGR